MSYIFIKINSEYKKVLLSDISFFKADGDYLKIYYINTLKYDRVHFNLNKAEKFNKFLQGT